MKNPRNGFVPRRTVKTTSGEVGVNGHQYLITFPRAGVRQTVSYHYDFANHPLRTLLGRFIVKDAPELAASSINQRCYVIRLLGEFFITSGATDLSPEVVKSFCRWLIEVRDMYGRLRFSDSALSTYLNHVKLLYKSGLENTYPGWSQQDFDLISAAVDKILRGCRDRSAQKSLDNAVPLDTYVSLVRAVAQELEQCRRALMSRNAGERESLYNLTARGMALIDPNPFVVLALLGALHHGMRSEELNSLTPQDLSVDEKFGKHEVYLHSPNKEDEFMPVSETFVESWRLCEEWGKEAHAIAGATGETLYKDHFPIYLNVKSRHPRKLTPLNSYDLNSNHLPYFFKKWFTCLTVDDSGQRRPLLHSPDDPTRPLSISYRKLRNAFGARVAEREKSRAVVARVLRHKNPKTGEKFYQHIARLDLAKKVHFALNAEAHSLAMLLKNPITAGVSEDMLRRARETRAVTPQGVCGSALEGNSCARASDCLECPFLVVVASRKPRFIADRDFYLKRAGEAERKGDLRGAENDLSRAKLCQAHIIRLEETFGGDNESGS